jgi:hypothetical protein
MPGGECHGFVEEKQLCIPIRGHYDAVPAPEFQNARDPPSAFVAADDFPVGVVQCTTAVAQHRAAGSSPEKIAERVNSVLKWHPEAPIMPPQQCRFSLAPKSAPLPEVAPGIHAAAPTENGTISVNIGSYPIPFSIRAPRRGRPGRGRRDVSARLRQSWRPGGCH